MHVFSNNIYILYNIYKIVYIKLAISIIIINLNNTICILGFGKAKHKLMNFSSSGFVTQSLQMINLRGLEFIPLIYKLFSHPQTHVFIYTPVHFNLRGGVRSNQPPGRLCVYRRD